MSNETIYQWRRRKFGGMDVDEAKRLKVLEGENAKLKKMLADRLLEIDVLKEINAKNGEPYRTWEKESLRVARERGVEGALATIKSTRYSQWIIEDVSGVPTRRIKIVYDPLERPWPGPRGNPQSVAILHGETCVLRATLSGNGKRLGRLHLFHDGEWMGVLTDRVTTATEEIVEDHA